MKSIGQLFVGLLAAAASALIVLAAASLALVEGGAVAQVSSPTATITASPPSFTASPLPLPEVASSPTTAITATPAQAATSTCPDRPPDWVEYIIQPGDTLDSLAAKYGVTTEALMKANCLNNSAIRLDPGWTINLPPSLPTPTLTETPAPPATPVPTRCIPNPPPGWVTYIVRRGDTLAGLSVNYGVNMNQLMRVNCITGPQDLKFGLPIFVPYRPTNTPVATNTPAAPTETETEAPTATESPSLTPSSTPVTITPKPKADQTITFDPLPDKIYGDQSFQVTATASSKLPVSFSASGACTIAGNVVTLTGAGSCSVTASQDGDSSYNPAAPVTRTFNIAKADQSITFPALSGKKFGDADFTVSATSSSNLTVSITSSTPGVCTIAGNTVTLSGAGNCTLTAEQAGDANFNAAKPVSQTFTVAKASQAIDFPAITDKTTGESPFTISATATSGLPVGFTSETPGVCTVFNSTVTLTKAGACTLAAMQAGDNNYLPAPNVSQTFQVTAP